MLCRALWAWPVTPDFLSVARNCVTIMANRNSEAIVTEDYSPVTETVTGAKSLFFIYIIYLYY